MKDVIKFYNQNNEYGYFSNFSAHVINVDGTQWPTSEHYFQAKKFENTQYEEMIRSIEKPGDAAKLGRDRRLPLRADWEQVKDAIMYKCVRAKFTQHKDLRALLLQTGTAKIVEHTKNDAYWADGGDGSGKNMLGQILMQIRDELKKDV